MNLIFYIKFNHITLNLLSWIWEPYRCLWIRVFTTDISHDASLPIPARYYVSAAIIESVQTFLSPACRVFVRNAFNYHILTVINISIKKWSCQILLVKLYIRFFFLNSYKVTELLMKTWEKGFLWRHAGKVSPQFTGPQ